MTDAKLSLHRKLAQVMYEAERIPKNGVGPKEQGSYPFVQVGDAADFIRKALAEKVVTMMPTHVAVVGQVDRLTAKGSTMTTVDLLVEWTLTDGESGESIVIHSFGAGADTGDKYSGKASTSAMKYALLTGFLLSTGEDTENHDTSDQRPTGVDTVELLGNLQKSGKVLVGGAEQYKGEWREEPDGHAIGFRLKLAGADERDIPQVLVKGSIGEALYLAGGQLVGQSVTVKGKLYNVKPAGRTAYYRLVVGDHPDAEFIETADVRIPALPDQAAEAPDATSGPETPAEVEPDTIPLFELDEAERAAVGGGLPE